MDADLPLVVVAEPIAEAGIELLRDHARVEKVSDRSELLDVVGDAMALIVRSATQVDSELIEAAPALKVIGRAGVGVDNIDLAAATAAGILVVNVPQANVVSAAEHTIALLLSQARRIPEADRSLRAGKWERSSLQGIELNGKVLGIIGLGRVGMIVAHIAAALGMRMLAYDPYVATDRARRVGVEMVDLGRLLEESDFVTIHVPRTRDTELLIDEAALRRVKHGIRIVNTARGGIVDEAALADAVRDGRVAGAALDVFSTEPVAESPLFELPQVVVTPHLGASTVEAQDKAGLNVAKAVLEALEGGLVPNAVNVEAGLDVPEETRPFLPLAERLGSIFVAVASGVPDELVIRVEGRLAEGPVRPIALAALKGVLSRVSDAPITFVNASAVARARGVTVLEEATRESPDYQSVIRVSGRRGQERHSVAGTTVGRKGPVITEALDHEVELPISRHMLLLLNDDVPGTIGRVGTYLGAQDININDMVVGRSTISGEAQMMGLSLNKGLGEDEVRGLRALEGVSLAVFVQEP